MPAWLNYCMRILYRFFGLPIRDQRLLLYSLVLLTLFKFALRWFSLKTLLFFSTKASSANADPKSGTKGSPDRVAWAVSSVARRIPTLGNCLAVALATKMLLNTEGCPANLRIGVTKGDFGQLEAHAWLESKGRVLIGSAEGDRYTPLPLFDGENK